MAKKVVLAYSGGLDTSVAIRWLKEERGYDVIALTIDLGNEKDLLTVEKRAYEIGAVKAIVRDGKQPFIDYFAFPGVDGRCCVRGPVPARDGDRPAAHRQDARRCRARGGGIGHRRTAAPAKATTRSGSMSARRRSRRTWRSSRRCASTG